MSKSSRDPKPRATKNSQRLYNLEQQEKLYKSLGISQSPQHTLLKSVNKQVMEEDLRQEAPSDKNMRDSDNELSDPEETKQASRNSKNAHDISRSESESEKEKEKEPDSEKKLKKKRKRASFSEDSSPKLNKGKKAKLQNGETSRKGKKSPMQGKGKGKKVKTNLSAPAIVLPDQMMVSPEDSSVIAAHMNAYTKWLMDNNMLVSQQSLNQFSGPQQNAGQEESQIKTSNQGQIAFEQSNVKNSQGIGSVRPLGSFHDISTDESSMCASEVEGAPPYIPQNKLNNGKTLPSPVQEQPQQQVGTGTLFDSCEKEKNVLLDDDNSIGPAVSAQMAEMIKNFLGRSRKTAKIDDLIQEFLRPKNMPFLKAPFIEDEVYGDLAPGARHFDKNCRQLQGYILAAITALSMSLQSLILTEKLHPLISEAGERVKKALQLLTFSTKDINDRRKDALKSSVNAEYLPLLKHAKPPSDDWLLGGELNESIKKCDDSKKLSEKIMKNRKSQPNQNQQQQNNNSQPYNQGQDRYRFKNKNRKDNKPFYRNYQNSQQNPNYNQTYYTTPPTQVNQGFVQPNHNQAQLWHQYQQQIQQAQALQAQQQNRQNLGFHQQPQQSHQQWRDQTAQQQNFNAYNKKKN